MKFEYPPAEDVMSAQERKYLDDMVLASSACLNAINYLNDILGGVFENNPLDTQLTNFQGIILDGHSRVQKLQEWSYNNMLMNRFPVNHDEVKAARHLAEEVKGYSWHLQQEYRMIANGTSHFDNFVTLATKINIFHTKNERMYTLLFRAQGAVSKHDCTVDSSLLHPLPEE